MKLLMESWREYLNESQVVDIDHEFGSASGVIHNELENIMNWVEKERLDDAAKNAIEQLKLPVVILKNINIDEESRSQGAGSSLMNRFMDEVTDASAIVLIADLGESQAEGFDLKKWYEDYGFETVGYSAEDPVMVLKL